MHDGKRDQFTTIIQRLDILACGRVKRYTLTVSRCDICACETHKRARVTILNTRSETGASLSRCYAPPQWPFSRSPNDIFEVVSSLTNQCSHIVTQLQNLMTQKDLDNIMPSLRKNIFTIYKVKRCKEKRYKGFVGQHLKTTRYV